MSLKKNIEELFKEESKSDPSSSHESEDGTLPNIPPTPDNNEQSDGGIEKREFTRIDVEEKKIELRFSNQMQFAYQYIENISLGGLFVKTNEKHEMGTILPIEFAVSLPGQGYQKFRLKGRVCRIAPEGLGLEFTNLNHENRRQLESYVRSVLPQNASVRAKAKKSTMDRLEQRRAIEAEKQRKRRATIKQVGFLVLLTVLNSWLIREHYITDNSGSVETSAAEVVEMGTQSFQANEIHSVQKDESDQLYFLLSDGRRVRLPSNDSNHQLPGHISQTIRILKTIPPAKQQRRSRTSATHTQLR